MTKQEIKESLIACAAQLKHVPSLEEVKKLTPVSHRQIVKNFGGYINALRSTGLELKSTIGRGHGVPMEKLFADWAGIVRKLKMLPSMNQYHMLSQYSAAPLMRPLAHGGRCRMASGNSRNATGLPKNGNASWRW
jgi:hypothetical protein